MGETTAGRHIDVRKATASDIPTLFSVRTSVRENHIDLARLAELGITPSSVAAALADGSTRAWVVEEQSVVVAFSIADTQTGSVFAVFVRPEAEGRGYGRALLGAAEEWLFARWELIWLQTDSQSDIRAHRLYRAAGWELIGPADHGEVRYEKRRVV
jgi:GNAT superfamily N-acetyltransferase